MLKSTTGDIEVKGPLNGTIARKTWLLWTSFNDESFSPLVGEDGVKRILVAVNHNIFDVSKGRHLYGPGNPYNVYAARDASRGLATFSVKPEVIRDVYDDLR